VCSKELGAGTVIRVQQVNLFPEEWTQLDAAPDRTLFQTKAWLSFVERTQKARLIVLKLFEGERHIGWFTGFLVQKGPLRILGSPFRGWTTPYMGFNLLKDIDLGTATKAVVEYAFQHLRCVHVELADRRLDFAAAERAGLDFQVGCGYELDLRKTEEELLASMHHSPRRYIRKATRERHVVVEEAEPAGFAEDYFSQLQDLCANHGLVPTYGLDRVKVFIDCLFPAGTLLLLRALSKNGESIATGLFAAFNGQMYAWGVADRPAFRRLHPNEPLQWHAMRYWKRRGIMHYDMGGGGHGPYKMKYGARPVEVPIVLRSRWPLVTHLRNCALGAHRFRTMMRGYVARLKLRRSLRDGQGGLHDRSAFANSRHRLQLIFHAFMTLLYGWGLV
jgi:CelD/BcsL family acetyltransferase involved in cellulose biosynthesis